MSEFNLIEQELLTKDLNEQQKLMFTSQYNSEKKNPDHVIIAAIFCLDRFLLGQVGMGLLKICSWGGFFVWWLIDLLNVKSRIGDYNRAKAQEIYTMAKTLYK